MMWAEDSYVYNAYVHTCRVAVCTLIESSFFLDKKLAPCNPSVLNEV